MTVHRAPRVLTLHIKRFAYSVNRKTAIKNSNHISFTEQLDLDRFMSFPQGARSSYGSMYTLYAVAVHRGAGARSGHYFSFVRAIDGSGWYRADDPSMTRTTLSDVLAQQAYVLFYARNNSGHPFPTPAPQATESIRLASAGILHIPANSNAFLVNH